MLRREESLRGKDWTDLGSTDYDVPMKAHKGLCKANGANNGKQTKGRSHARSQVFPCSCASYHDQEQNSEVLKHSKRQPMFTL